MKTVKDNEDEENKDDKIVGERKDEDSKRQLDEANKEEDNNKDLVLDNYLIYMCMNMYVAFSSYGVIEFFRSYGVIKFLALMEENL